MRPIVELSAATAHVAEGRFDGDLVTSSDDEIGQLSRSFDAMRHALRERSEALERGRAQLRRRNRLLHDEVRDRRRAEEALARRTRELERANAKLAHRNEELDEFTYVASHDLQEPLRKLKSFSRLLVSDMGDVQLPERAARDLEFIHQAADRMRCLVQDLLELSRAGRAAMNVRETPLGLCLDAALDQLELQIKERNADIRREPLPTAEVDRTLITQLFQNLIGNAIKFQRGDRRPVVEVTVEDSAGGPIIGVRDRGIGIKPEFAERIFTPFKRLHGRHEYEGTGIGLAVCRKAVARHGGRIWVESAAGEGAHFRFTLSTEARSDRCRKAA